MVVRMLQVVEVGQAQAVLVEKEVAAERVTVRFLPVVLLGAYPQIMCVYLWII